MKTKRIISILLVVFLLTTIFATVTNAQTPSETKVEVSLADRKMENVHVPELYLRGDAVRYDVYVRNDSTEVLKNIKITCNPDASIINGSFDYSDTPTGDPNQSIIDSLDPKEDIFFSYNAQIDSNATIGLIQNKIIVSHDGVNIAEATDYINVVDALIEVGITETIAGKEVSGYTDENGNAVYTTVINEGDILTYEITVKNLNIQTVSRNVGRGNYNNVVVSANLPAYTEFLEGYTPTGKITYWNGSSGFNIPTPKIEGNKVVFTMDQLPKDRLFTGQFKVKVTEKAGTALKQFDCFATIKGDEITETDTYKLINNIYPATAGINITAKKIGTDTVIKDVGYDLYKQVGNTPDTNTDTKITALKTGDTGSVPKSELELGKYYLINTEVPAGYAVSDIPLPFELKDAQRAVPLEILHEIDTSVSGLKIGIKADRTTITNGVKTPGVYKQKDTVSYGVEVVNTGNVTATDIKVDIVAPNMFGKTGFSVADGETPVNFPTGEKSVIKFDKGTPNAISIDKLAANKKITIPYSATVLASAEKGNYDVTASLTANDIPNVSDTDTITVNADKVTVTTVTFKVVDTDAKPIKNAEFSLENKQTQTEFKKVISDENGILVISDVPMGDYVIKQISTPPGYIKINESIPVTVSPELEVAFDGKDALVVTNGIIKYKATIFNDTPNKTGGAVKAGDSKTDLYKSYTENIYKAGDTVLMQFIPNTGYIVDRLMVGGTEYYISGTKLYTEKNGKGTEYPNAIVGTNSISFGNITENINMNVTFKTGPPPKSLKVEMTADKTVVNADGTKTAGVYTRGDAVEYKIKVTNTGTALLKNVNISCDPAMAIINGSLSDAVIPTLEVNQTEEILFSAKVASNATAGLIRNEVKVSHDEVSLDEDDKDVDYIKIEGETPAPTVKADVTFNVADTDKQTVVGATYVITSASKPTEILATKTSNVIGLINFAGMPEGEYIVKNTDVPQGYLINTDEVPVKVLPDKSVSFNGKVEKFVSILEKLPHKPVEKTNVEMYVSDGENFLEGTEFEMRTTDTQTEGYSKTGFSSNAGKIVFPDVPKGQYYIKQLKTLEGYNISTDKFVVNVNEKSEVEFVLPDKSKVTQLVVINTKKAIDSHIIQGVIDNGGTIDYVVPTLLKDTLFKKITWIPKENFETTEIKATIGEHSAKSKFENGGAILKINDVEYEVKLTKDNVHYIDFGQVATDILVEVTTTQINPDDLKFTVTTRASSGGTIDGKMSNEVTYKGIDKTHTSTIKPNANYAIEKVELFKAEKDGATKLVSALPVTNNSVSFKVDSDYLLKASFVKDPNATQKPATGNSANKNSNTNSSGKSGSGSQTGDDGLPFTILLIGIGAVIAVLAAFAYKKKKNNENQ